MPKSQAGVAKERQHLTVANFFGGLNEDPNSSAVEDTEFADLQNMYWRGRMLASRPGTELHNATAANSGAVCTGLFNFTRAGGGSADFVGIFGNKIMQDVAGTWTDITGAVTITAGQNNLFTGAIFKDVLVVTNGVDAPIKWTGTGNAAALGGSPPTAPYVAAKWGRLFLAGMSSDRGVIRYSAVNDHESWGAGNELRIFVAGEEWITGLVSYRDFLLVLTNKQIYPVTANEGEGTYLQPFNVDKNKPLQVGVASQRAFVTIGDDAVFLDYDGQVRSLQATQLYGNVEEAALSRKIAPTTLKNTTLARAPYAAAAYFPALDWVVFALSPSGTTTNTLLIVLDLKDTAVFLDPVRARPKWTKFTGLSANAFCVRTVSGISYLYFGDYSGFVRRFNETVLNDNGKAFSKVAKTKWFDMGSPQSVKSLRTFAVEAMQNNSTLTINHYFDYNTAASSSVSFSLSGGVAGALWNTAVWGTDVWSGADAATVMRDWRGTGRGAVFQTEFKNLLAGESFALLRYDYGIMVIGER